MIASDTDSLVDRNPEKGQSSEVRAAPVLTRRGLTVLLILMCLVPIITLTILQFTMPPVLPGTLIADVALIDAPPGSYYETDLGDRVQFPKAALFVRNLGEHSWTHLNVRINNGNYQIYEHASPIEPGQGRVFLLNRFVHRSGAVFDVGINRPRSVEVYARLPDKSRGTFESELK